MTTTWFLLILSFSRLDGGLSEGTHSQIMDSRESCLAAARAAQGDVVIATCTASVTLPTGTVPSMEIF